MGHLQRTQIYIDEDQVRRLKSEAARDNVGMSELVRRAIDRFLRARERKVNWESDSVTTAVGKVKLAVSDASRKHDQYLYGRRKGK